MAFHLLYEQWWLCVCSLVSVMLQNSPAGRAQPLDGRDSSALKTCSNFSSDAEAAAVITRKTFQQYLLGKTNNEWIRLALFAVCCAVSLPEQSVRDTKLPLGCSLYVRKNLVRIYELEQIFSCLTFS